MKRNIMREVRPDFLLAIHKRIAIVIKDLSDVLVDLNRAEDGVIWMSNSQSGLAGLRQLERMVVQARRAYNEGQIPLFRTVLKIDQPLVQSDVCDLEERG